MADPVVDEELKKQINEVKDKWIYVKQLQSKGKIYSATTRSYLEAFANQINDLASKSSFIKDLMKFKPGKKLSKDIDKLVGKIKTPSHKPKWKNVVDPLVSEFCKVLTIEAEGKSSMYLQNLALEGGRASGSARTSAIALIAVIAIGVLIGAFLLLGGDDDDLDDLPVVEDGELTSEEQQVVDILESDDVETKKELLITSRLPVGFRVKDLGLTSAELQSLYELSDCEGQGNLCNNIYNLFPQDYSALKDDCDDKIGKENEEFCEITCDPEERDCKEGFYCTEFGICETQKGEGEPCSSYDECEAFPIFCKDNFCTKWKCERDSECEDALNSGKRVYCDDGDCKKYKGEVCYTNDACSEGEICFKTMCLPSFGEENQRCEFRNQCSEGLRCIWELCKKVTGVLDSPCERDYDCEEGACIQAKCTSIPVEDEEDCEEDKHCYEDSYCSESYRVCKPKPGLGEECDRDRPCVEGDCIAWKCSLTLAGPTEFCLHTGDCQSGLICIDGKCSRDLLKQGSDCTADDQCTSGMCIKRKCSKDSLETGDDCSADDQCPSGTLCLWSKCRELLGLGEICLNDRECSGEWVCDYQADVIWPPQCMTPEKGREKTNIFEDTKEGGKRRCVRNYHCMYDHKCWDNTRCVWCRGEEGCN
ncbi:hypothetical protein ACFL0W_05935 [Nanoarchaeota archaeon]